MSDQYTDKPRRPLRETVCEIDRDILRLVMRRHNIVAKMAAGKSHLAPQEEKYLREAWEAQVARVSTDPLLSSRFFSLMQQVEFLPKPGEETEQVREQKHNAFGLAPTQKPVRIALAAPRDCLMTRAYMALAAASGQPMKVAPALMNDPIVHCLKMLNQMGASLNREIDCVVASQGSPIGTPDTVLFVGDNMYNFCLALGHYLGRPSHAKFNGDGELKMTDLTALRHFLPTLGARLVHIVPRSDSFPVRVESSGLLPDRIAFPADVPAELPIGMALAAPFYDKPVTLDLSALPESKKIFNFIYVLLKSVDARISGDSETIHIEPSEIVLPASPTVPAAASIASVLMLVTALLTGEADLEGVLPDTEGARGHLALLAQAGVTPTLQGGHIRYACKKPFTMPEGGFAIPEGFPAEWLPLPVALTCAWAMREGKAVMPVGYAAGDSAWATAESFVKSCGLAVDGEGVVTPAAREEDAERGPAAAPSFIAPTAAWAVALSLAACARPRKEIGLRLGNPGILTGLFPGYWPLYNSLPDPSARTKEAPKGRRRIRTDAVAQLTPRDEDV